MRLELLLTADYSDLRTTLPRHKELAKVYVDVAIKLVDRLQELQKEERHGSQKNS